MFKVILLNYLFLLAAGVVAAQKNTTVQVHMDADVEICVGEKVLLTCPDTIPEEKVLTYEWIEYKENGDSVIVSTERSFWVQPIRETSYRLNLQYLDMNNNLIKYGDFEGIPDSPGGKFPNQTSLPFTTGYRWETKTGQQALWDEGVFKFASNPRTYHTNFWVRGDHTTGHGQMMVINGHPRPNAKVWQQKIAGIKPGGEYAFSAWGMNVSDGAKPRFQFSISKNDNYNVIGGMYETYSPDNTWTMLFKMWKAPADWGNKAYITLIDQTTDRNGNDFAVDDLVFAPVLNLTGKVTLRLIPRFDMGEMADVEVCAGEKVEVSPVIYGEADKFQWYKGNVKLEGQNALKLVLNQTKKENSGTYICKATGGSCGEGEGKFALTVNDSLILEPLVDITVCKNNEVKWMVKVQEGKEHVKSYNWSAPAKAKNWQGQYSSTYWKRQVVAADTGLYSCKVNSRCGDKTVAARLAIYPDIQVTEVSGGGIYCPGTPVTLTGKTNRPAEVSWNWGYESGNNHYFSGNTLTITPDGVDVTYMFFVNDLLCRDIVLPAPTVQLFLKDTLKSVKLDKEQVVCENSPVLVIPKVSGGENLNWMWSGPNGFTLAAKKLEINHFTKEQSGVYTLTVTDDCGKSLAASINITTIEEFGTPVISGNLKVCLGERDDLEVTGGVDGLKYEWTTPAGKKVLSSKLSLTRILAQDTGWYTCRLTSVCGNSQDLRTHVSLYPPVSVEEPQMPFEVCEGDNMTFTVQAGADQHYVWMKNGVRVGQPDQPYVIPVASVADGGVYECVVTSPCGESKKLNYVLKVHPTTVITDKSNDLYVTPGTPDVRLVVQASGSDLAYQWKKVNGGNVGLGNSSLFFDVVSLQDAGTYICTVTGRCGKGEATIKLNVGDYNELTEDQEVQLCMGSTYSYTAAKRPENCTETAAMVYSWKDPHGVEVSNTKALTLSDVTAATAGVYSCTIAGTCGTATLHLTVSVLNKPIISVVPVADTLCEGEKISMLATVNQNIGSHMFEWRHEGNLLGATVEQYTVQNVAISDAGRYVCKVDAHCGEDLDTVLLTVRKGLKILNKPVDLSLCKGSPAELKVEATGDSVTYAWAGPVAEEWSSADAAVYQNPSVSYDATGRYRCVVNSSCGTDTLYADIDVEKKLELVSRTPNLAACIGEKVTLWARVNLDNAAIAWSFPDGTHSNLEEVTINSITTAHRGHYVFEIESPRGCSALKDSIGIGVYNEPGPLTVAPLDTAVCEGGQARFIAEMTGTEVTYSWMGPGMFKADTAIIDIPDVRAEKTGTYQVIAKDICEYQRIAEVNLSLRQNLEHLTISPDTAICLFSDVQFEVKGGIPGMNYTWYFNGAPIGDDAVLKLDNIEEDKAGEYICRIQDVCGSIDKKVRLTILEPLEFSRVTDAVAEVCVDETVVFGVQATGTGVEYRWQKGGVDVGTMDSLLTLSDIEAWEGGRYECHISSVCGVDVMEFELKVKPQTRITGRSPDKYVPMNDSLRLFVIAEGVNNEYEWKKENNVIGHDSLLHVSDVGSVIRDEIYQIKVHGDCGEDTTSIKIKIGDYIDVPSIGKGTDTICEGSNYAYAADLIPYGCYGGEPVSYIWEKIEGGTEIFIERDTTSALFKINEAIPADTGLYRCKIKYRGCPIDGGDTTHIRDTAFDLRLAMIRVPLISSIVPKDTTVVEGFEHQIQVNAQGDALSYKWQKDDTTTLTENGTSLKFFPVIFEDEGIYRVTVSNKCSDVAASSRLKVTQKTLIVSALYDTLGVCRYSDTTLRVEAIGTNLIYRWYSEGRLMASSRHNEYAVKQVTKDMDFTCVVDGKGGKDTCYFKVQVLDLPEVEIDGLADICMSPDSYLQEYMAVSPHAGELNWNWSIVGGTIHSQRGGQEVEVLWAGEEDATITVMATSRITGCQNQADLSVHYIPLPEVWLDLPDKVGYCIDSLVLNQAWPMGGSFISEGDTITVLEFYVKNKGYDVTYVYTSPLTHCTNQVRHQIGVDIEPAIRLAKQNDTTGICRPLNLPVALHTPGVISWKGSGLSLDTTDPLNPLFTPVEADAEHVYYEATVTDAYECKASDYTRIRVVYPPKVTAMKDTVVGNCGNEPVEIALSAQYITAYFNYMTWLPAEQIEVHPDYTGKIMEILPGKNEYIAEVYDVFGCKGKDSVIVTLASGPDLADREICLGDSIEIDQSGVVDFSWSDGYAFPRRLITQVGSDTLWVKDEYGCEAKAVYTVRPLPETGLVDTFLLRGHRLELPLNLNPDYAPYDIVWQDGSAVAVYIAERDGEYWVKVTDNMGCTVSDTARLTFIEGIYAPNAFLPESYGDNSRFYLKEVNFIGEFEMYIYNRWGELVFKTREIGFNGGWDGTFKGKKCDVGTYVWVAYNNGKQLGKGTVTLIK